jgi:phenylalanyl-tRNA synthetase beta chain
MKVSKSWLEELVEIKNIEKVIDLLPLRTIGTKEITSDFIELDMKGYNRADLLSLRGVAYEVAAISNSKVKFNEPDESKFIWVEKSLEKVEVIVEDENFCPVYCLARVENLKVEQSDNTWVKKLSDSGIRSVNNIADVTNLVMLEYGQPLHSFDADKTQGVIGVRFAKSGESIVTLDNKKRQLNLSDLLITDSNGPIGMAGVMGGKDSEVTASTTTILLEAAIFDPVTLRKAASTHGMYSEASKRFYHGLTRKRLFQALDAAIKLYANLGGKLTGLTIVGDVQDSVKKIPLALKKTNELIGIKLTKDETQFSLEKLNFNLLEQEDAQGNPGWIVTPPYYRLDIELEEDLIEEVARMYGYEKIPAKKLEGKMPDKVDQSIFEIIQKLKSTLAELGFIEVQTYNYFSTQVLENYDWTQDNNLKHLVKLANPISKETEYLRQNIWSNLVESAGFNLKRGVEEIAAFEIGKIYTPQKEGVPNEAYSAAVILINNTDNPIAELHEAFLKVSEKLNLEVDKSSPQGVAKNLFHPTRFLAITHKGEQIGGLAEVHPRVLNKFGIQKRAAILEFYIEKLV